MKTKTTRKLAAVPSAMEAAKEWAEIRNQIDALERRKTVLKAILSEHLSSLPEPRTELGDYLCTLNQTMSTERFNLAKAKEKLDLRLLKPFITRVAGYSVLRVTYKGEGK